MTLRRLVTLVAAAFLGLLRFTLSAQDTGADPIQVTLQESVQGTVVCQYTDIGRPWNKLMVKGETEQGKAQEWLNQLRNPSSIEDLVYMVRIGNPEGLLVVSTGTYAYRGVSATVSWGPPPRFPDAPRNGSILTGDGTILTTLTDSASPWINIVILGNEASTQDATKWLKTVVDAKTVKDLVSLVTEQGSRGLIGVTTTLAGSIRVTTSWVLGDGG